MIAPHLAWAWEPSTLVLAPTFVVALRFAHAVRRLRRRGRGDLAGPGRIALFVLGLACVALPPISPLDAAGDRYLFSAHMLEHVLLGDLGPALLLVALRGPLLAFVVPAPLARLVHRTPPLRRTVAAIAHPVGALLCWAAVLAVWHLPTFYEAALRHPTVHAAEHLSLALGGTLVWIQLVDPARRRRLSLPGRAAYAGVLFLLGQVLGGILLLASTPLYTTYADQPVRLLGLSTITDQRFAGLTMMAEQMLTLGSCVVLLLAASIRPERQRALARPALG